MELIMIQRSRMRSYIAVAVTNLVWLYLVILHQHIFTYQLSTCNRNSSVRIRSKIYSLLSPTKETGPCYLGLQHLRTTNGPCPYLVRLSPSTKSCTKETDAFT